MHGSGYTTLNPNPHFLRRKKKTFFSMKKEERYGAVVLSYGGSAMDLNDLRQRPQQRLILSVLILPSLLLLAMFSRFPVNWPAQHTLFSDPCLGKRIYMYNLPTKFNLELLKHNDSWEANMCQNFENAGMGREVKMGKEWGSFDKKQGPWYATWQFSLEIYFHFRVRRHSCLTKSEDEADLFYVPYYAGFDLRRRIFHGLPRDELYLELLNWLQKQRGWKKRKQRKMNHFMVLGRISSDFKRAIGKKWGSEMLNDPRWKRVIKLTIEQSTNSNSGNDSTEIAIPYPTSFHPNSKNQVELLQKWALQSDQRTSLACIAGGKRAGGLRTRVIRRCQKDSRCTNLFCNTSSPDLTQPIKDLTGQTIEASCRTPSPIFSLFHSCEFCLQPPGDSPTRRSFFDSMLAGCIPVIFKRKSAWTQYRFHLPYPDGSNYSVLVAMDDHHRSQRLMNILEAIPADRRQQLRTNISYLIPRIVYSCFAVTHEMDAFNIALDAIFNMVH